MLAKFLDGNLPLSKGPAHNLYIIYIAVHISSYAIESYSKNTKMCF